MQDNYHGKQDNREIKSNVENEGTYRKIVFKEPQLSLYGNSWRVEQVRNRKGTFQYWLIAEIETTRTTQIPIHDQFRGLCAQHLRTVASERSPG